MLLTVDIRLVCRRGYHRDMHNAKRWVYYEGMHYAKRVYSMHYGKGVPDWVCPTYQNKLRYSPLFDVSKLDTPAVADRKGMSMPSSLSSCSADNKKRRQGSQSGSINQSITMHKKKSINQSTTNQPALQTQNLFLNHIKTPGNRRHSGTLVPFVRHHDRLTRIKHVPHRAIAPQR